MLRIRGAGRTRCIISVASAARRRRSIAVTSLHEVVPVDEEVLPRDLEALKRFAFLMDEAVAIPGTRRRFGLDAALGLIPGVGDAIGGGMAAWVVVAGAGARGPAL